MQKGGIATVCTLIIRRQSDERLTEDVTLQEETGRSNSKGMHFYKGASCSHLLPICVNI